MILPIMLLPCLSVEIIFYYFSKISTPLKIIYALM